VLPARQRQGKDRRGDDARAGLIRVSVIEIRRQLSRNRAAGQGGARLFSGHRSDELVPGGRRDEQNVLALASLDGGEGSGVVLGTRPE